MREAISFFDKLLKNSEKKVFDEIFALYNNLDLAHKRKLTEKREKALKNLVASVSQEVKR